MKLTAPYRCDYCQNIKGATNHWRLRLTKGAVEHVYGVTSARDSFLLTDWGDLLAAQDDVEHICSESCATKALAKWMGEQSRGGNVDVPRPTDIEIKIREGWEQREGR